MGRCRFIATVRKSLEKGQKSIDSEKKSIEQPEGITLFVASLGKAVISITYTNHHHFFRRFPVFRFELSALCYLSVSPLHRFPVSSLPLSVTPTKNFILRPKKG